MTPKSIVTAADVSLLTDLLSKTQDELAAAIKRAEKAEADLAEAKDELARMDTNLMDADKEMANVEAEAQRLQGVDLANRAFLHWQRETLAVLRIVRDMIVSNFQCNHPPDDGGDDCDGDDCIRCAVMIQIDRALGEVKARG